MLQYLITNKTRLKLLFKFFLNNETTSYLRNLESEFGESSNAVRIELNRLEEAELLVSKFEGNKKYFRANIAHPLYADINNILQKTVGLDTIIENVLAKTDELKKAYLIGDLAIGKESANIELLLIGENLDSSVLAALVAEAEQSINRKISYQIIKDEEKDQYLNNNPALLIFG